MKAKKKTLRVESIFNMKIKAVKSIQSISISK